MQITCERALLLKGVQTAARAVNPKSTLPVLANLYVAASQDSIHLVGTDLEVGIECRLPAQVAEEGALTIPAKVFTEVLSQLPDEQVSIATEEGNMAVIRGERAEFRILGLPADEFPLLPEVGEEMRMAIDPDLLRAVIKETIFAASKDEARAILMGALFTVREGNILRLVTTDGHRLAISEAPLEEAPQTEVNLIVPASALEEVARIAGQAHESVVIRGSQNQLQFSFGHINLTTRLIEGQFPDYEQVIPKESKTAITAPRRELLGCIKRLAIVARQNANKIIFRISDGEIVMSAESQEVGKAEERLVTEVEGEPMEIAFNAQYLAEALNVLSSDIVRFELTGTLSPGVIKPVGEERFFLYIVMPMQIL